MKKGCSLYLFDELQNNERIASPLNYTGGKFRLLPQILPLFPLKIRHFVDLFCGGCNVGINVCAEQVIFNDLDSKLIGLLQMFQNTDMETILSKIDSIVQRYGLSQSSEMGYDYYGANSADGLANVNRTAYLQLREDFNQMEKTEDEYYVLLYALIVFGFNNQIRFNRAGKYNLPVGKRDFNQQVRKKLLTFWERLHSGRYIFLSQDFRSFELDSFAVQDFVYADPPYLITCATYNEQDGWNEQDELALLDFLDQLHQRGVRFALSNVLKSKGRSNLLLKDWCQHHSDEYYIHFLNYNYANSNYQTKDRSVTSSEEVLITNYQP